MESGPLVVPTPTLIPPAVVTPSFNQTPASFLLLGDLLLPLSLLLDPCPLFLFHCWISLKQRNDVVFQEWVEITIPMVFQGTLLNRWPPNFHFEGGLHLELLPLTLQCDTHWTLDSMEGMTHKKRKYDRQLRFVLMTQIVPQIPSVYLFIDQDLGREWTGGLRKRFSVSSQWHSNRNWNFEKFDSSRCVKASIWSMILLLNLLPEPTIYRLQSRFKFIHDTFCRCWVVYSNRWEYRIWAGFGK